MFFRGVLLALVCAVQANGGEQCARGAVTHFSVRGAYNASGHWEGEVRVERDAQQRGRRGLQLEVQAWPQRCATQSTDVLLVHAQDCSSYLLIKVSSTSLPTRVLREGYQIIPGFGSYKLHGMSVPWDEANSTCVAEGSHLLVLDTQEEADEIQKLINKVPKATNWIHIGFHDKKKTKNYITVLGQPLLSTNYNRWDPGEPHQSGEQCGGISKTLGLVDISCTSHNVMFICEEYS